MELQSYFILCQGTPPEEAPKTGYSKRGGNISTKNNIENLFSLYWLKNIYVISETPETIIHNFPMRFPNNQLVAAAPTAARVKSICDVIVKRSPQASITICYLNDLIPDFAHLRKSLEDSRNIARHYPVLLSIGADNKDVDLTHGYLRYNQATNHSAKEVSQYHPHSPLNCLTVKYDNDVICHSGIISANAMTLTRNFNEMEAKYENRLEGLTVHGLLEQANNLYVLPSQCSWYMVGKPSSREAKSIQLKIA